MIPLVVLQILLVFACVCFLMVAINFPKTDPPNPYRAVAAGLFLWVLVILLGGIK